MGTHVGSCIHHMVKIQQCSVTTWVACVLLLKPHPPPSSVPRPTLSNHYSVLHVYFEQQVMGDSSVWPLSSMPHTDMISHISTASCLDEGPDQVLGATKGCIVEAALVFSRRKQASVQHPQDISQWGLQSTLGFIIPFTTHNPPSRDYYLH